MSRFYTERGAGVIWCRRHSSEDLAAARVHYVISLRKKPAPNYTHPHVPLGERCLESSQEAVCDLRRGHTGVHHDYGNEQSVSERLPVTWDALQSSEDSRE